MAEGGNGDDTNKQSLTTFGSESVFDFYCEVCRDDGKHIEADGFCVNCDEYLCDACLSAHKRLRPMRHHVLMNKDQMPQDSPLSQDRLSSKMCSIHSGKPIEYYCRSHDVIGCTSCFVTGHTGCSGVEYIEQTSRDIFDSKECTSFFQSLEYLLKEVNELSGKVRASKARAEVLYFNAVHKVHEFRQEVNTILDTVEEHFVTKAKTKTSETTERLEALDCKLSTISEEICKLSADASNLKTGRRHRQLYIKIKETSSGIQAHRKDLNSLKDRAYAGLCSFQPSKELKTYLTKTDTFGRI